MSSSAASLAFTIALACFIQLSAARMSASAFIHEEDGVWGSITFHQWNKHSPVIISILFQNIKIGDKEHVDWNIHEEPVHYEQYSPDVRCGARALKSVMKVADNYVGELGTRHGMISGPRFAEVTYDWELSLYPDSPKNIIGKSFVIRQGDNEADYRCATIRSTTLHSQRPGAVPCEEVRYADCLVGTARDDLCVYRPCTGYRQFWGEVDQNTKMCAQRYERFPKPLHAQMQADGVVSCRHGNHTLLKPLDMRTWL